MQWRGKRRRASCSRQTCTSPRFQVRVCVPTCRPASWTRCVARALTSPRPLLAAEAFREWWESEHTLQDTCWWVRSLEGLQQGGTYTGAQLYAAMEKLCPCMRTDLVGTRAATAGVKRRRTYTRKADRCGECKTCRNPRLKKACQNRDQVQETRGQQRQHQQQAKGAEQT